MRRRSVFVAAVQSTVSAIVAAMIGIAAASAVCAAPLIVNGGFESGFASWTRADQLGSDGMFFLQVRREAGKE